MTENVVRHQLGAERATEVLKLLTDYRWVERMNEDKERAPFQKKLVELHLSRSHLEEEEKLLMGKRAVRDIEVVVRTMEPGTPHCEKPQRVFVPITWATARIETRARRSGVEYLEH